MNYPQPVISPMGQVTDLKITRFLLVGTGTYNKQFSRPYSIDVRGDTAVQISEVLNQNPTITAANLSGISNQFFHPTANPEREVGMINGWNQRRFRYMLELEYERSGLVCSEVVLGYSEYDGITQNNHIDDKMRFFVNSVISTRVTPVVTGTGMRYARQISDSSQVLHDPTWMRHQSNVMTHENRFNLRPEDIFGVMGSGIDPSLYEQAQVMDSRTMARDAPTIAQRGHNIASSYCASMLSSYHLAASDGMRAEEEVMGAARGYARSTPSDHMVFLRNLRQLSGSPTAAFTMRDLRNISPHIQHVTHISHLNEAQRIQQVHQTGMTADWHGSDMETMYASILAQSIPAMMMAAGIVRVTVMSTNARQLDTQMYTRVLNANAFGTMDVSSAAENFRNRFEIELVRDFTFNNQIGYHIHCDFDLLGESRISLSLNGQPAIDYVVPSFADSLFSPMVTYNNGMASNIADGFYNLFNGLEHINQQNQQQYATVGVPPTFPNQPAAVPVNPAPASSGIITGNYTV